MENLKKRRNKLSEQKEVDKKAKLIATDSKALLDTAKFEHLWRVATVFAKSDLVPDHYKGKTENVLITTQMAIRLNVDPMMMMQNTYIVHGKPGIEAKLAIALINTSGMFDDPLSYEIEGETMKPGWRCRAWTKRKGERIDGPWVTYEMITEEGWDKKNGSKWKTMPELMIQYRAATFFGRLKCPERLMGMQTVDELNDVGVIVSQSDKKMSSIDQKILETKEANFSPESGTVAAEVEETEKVPEKSGFDAKNGIHEADVVDIKTGEIKENEHSDQIEEKAETPTMDDIENKELAQSDQKPSPETHSVATGKQKTQEELELSEVRKAITRLQVEYGKNGKMKDYNFQLERAGAGQSLSKLSLAEAKELHAKLEKGLNT